MFNILLTDEAGFTRNRVFNFHITYDYASCRYRFHTVDTFFIEHLDRYFERNDTRFSYFTKPLNKQCLAKYFAEATVIF